MILLTMLLHQARLSSLARLGGRWRGFFEEFATCTDSMAGTVMEFSGAADGEAMMGLFE